MPGASTRPDWLTLPNAVTLLRMLLLAPVCWLLIEQAVVSVGSVALLVLWAATDWIDGFLARRLDQVSRAGQVFDPIADRIGIGAVVISLAVADHLSWWAVGIVVVTDILTGILAGRAAAQGRIQVHLFGKARTAVMFTGIAVLVAALAFEPAFTVVGTAIIWVGAAMHIVAGASYIRGALRTAPDRPQVTP